MIEAASPADLRAWIADHLDPLDSEPDVEAAFRSDHDLNGDHPSPTPPLKPAAVLIPLIEREGGYTVLLTRRADTLRSHTGQVALPGGRIDPGESPVECALREAREEVGLDPALVDLAGLSTRYRTMTGYAITPVVGFVRPPLDLSPNPHEVADLFETPFGFLMDPANHERREGRSPAGDLRRFYAMTWENRMIWGATAGILRALYDRLYGAALG